MLGSRIIQAIVTWSRRRHQRQAEIQAWLELHEYPSRRDLKYPTGPQ